jgi:hypothetical protein
MPYFRWEDQFTQSDADQLYVPLSHSGLMFTSDAAETVNRVLGSAAVDGPSSGTACLTMFLARDTITVGNVTMITGGTAASGTTLARMGLYTIDGSDNATLVARTASDTNLFGSTATSYTRAFDTTGSYPATYTIQEGSVYALGVITVATTPPAYLSTSINAAGAHISGLMALSPRLVGNLNGQADLPTTISAGSYVNRGRLHYGRFTA